jgi:hypothetical protein
MRRMAFLIVAAALVLLVAIQLGLPRLIARHVAARLTEHGGHARVKLTARPSPLLLLKRGDLLHVRATGLTTGPPEPQANTTRGSGGGQGGLSDLDGFREVDIQVVGVAIGPFQIARLTLVRDRADAPYTATVQATLTGAELSAFAGRWLGGGIGGFLGGIGGGMVPGSGLEIPVDVEAVLRSEDGRVRATAVRGNVAGLPAGPFVEALATALAVRF